VVTAPNGSDTDTLPGLGIFALEGKTRRFEEIAASICRGFRLSETNAAMSLAAMVVNYEPPAGTAGSLASMVVKRATAGASKGISGAASGGMTAIVGGRERAVGSWGGYEIDRRAASGESGNAYVGRGYIGGLDAAASLLKTARLNHGDGKAVPHSALAIQGLVEIIQEQELDASKQDWWDTHERVSISSTNLREVADKIKEEGFATLEDLQEGLAAAAFVVETYLKGAVEAGALNEQESAAKQAIDSARAPRKTLQEHDYVVLNDGLKAVAALEEKSRPYVEAAEKSEALVAAYIERVTAALKTAVADA
jgi:hypothetical protein